MRLKCGELKTDSARIELEKGGPRRDIRCRMRAGLSFSLCVGKKEDKIDLIEAVCVSSIWTGIILGSVGTFHLLLLYKFTKVNPFENKSLRFISRVGFVHIATASLVQSVIMGRRYLNQESVHTYNMEPILRAINRLDKIRAMLWNKMFFFDEDDSKIPIILSGARVSCAWLGTTAGGVALVMFPWIYAADRDMGMKGGVRALFQANNGMMAAFYSLSLAAQLAKLALCRRVL